MHSGPDAPPVPGCAPRRVLVRKIGGRWTVLLDPAKSALGFRYPTWAQAFEYAHGVARSTLRRQAARNCGRCHGFGTVRDWASGQYGYRGPMVVRPCSCQPAALWPGGTAS